MLSRAEACQSPVIHQTVSSWKSRVMSGPEARKWVPWTQSFPLICHRLQVPLFTCFSPKEEGGKNINNSLCSEKPMRYSSDFQKSCSELSLSSTCALLPTLLCLDSYLLQTGQNSFKSWPALAPKLPPFLRIPQFPCPELSMSNWTKNHNQVQMLPPPPCTGEGTPGMGGF